MTTPPEMAEALAQLWVKFLPEMELRVLAIETAARSQAAGTLTPEERLAGQAAAHKLAGSLGLFGMARGTEIARELEELLASADMAQLTLYAGVGELQAIIAARSLSSQPSE